MERVTHCQIHDLPNPSCVNDQISWASWEGHILELVIRYINDRNSAGRATGRRSIFEESVQPMEKKIALEACQLSEPSNGPGLLQAALSPGAFRGFVDI